MNHRRIKDWIDEYVDHTLSPEKALEMEQHIEDCSECRERVSLARMTRQIVLAARLEDECAPSPRFVAFGRGGHRTTERDLSLLEPRPASGHQGYSPHGLASLHSSRCCLRPVHSRPECKWL